MVRLFGMKREPRGVSWRGHRFSWNLTGRLLPAFKGFEWLWASRFQGLNLLGESEEGETKAAPIT